MSLKDALQALAAQPDSIALRAQLATALEAHSEPKAQEVREATIQLAAARGQLFTALALGRMYLPGGELAKFVSSLAARVAGGSSPGDSPSPLPAAAPVSIECPEEPVALSDLAWTFGKDIKRVMPETPVPFPSLLILSELTQIEFVVLALEMEALVLHPDEPLLRQGDDEKAVYLLSHGSVRVERSVGDESIQLAKVQAPAVLGEMSLLTKVRRRASVIPETMGMAWRIDGALLQRLRDSHPSLESQLHALAKGRLLGNLGLSSQLLFGLSPEEREELLASFLIVRASSGEAVVELGEAPVGLFFLLHGEAEVWDRSAEGEPVRAEMLEEGELFGEISTLTGLPTMAEVKMPQGGVLLHCPADSFQALRGRHPDWVERLEGLKEERIAFSQDTRGALHADFEVLDASHITEEYLDDFLQVESGRE